MSPELSAGDRLIFSSFKLPEWLSGTRDEEALPFKRGSIVLIDMGRSREQALFLRIIDTVVRFWTAQRISIFSHREQFYIKRIVAFPADEISMTDYVFRIKTQNNLYSLTEFELSEKPYHLTIPLTHVLWDETLPFSPVMDTVILGQDEYFVLSDDRSNTNDSRTWGAVPSSLITARAVLRIWPLNKLKLL